MVLVICSNNLVIISAINANDFTVTVSFSAAPGSMSGKVLTLTNGTKVVNADYLSTNGNDVTFVVRASDRAGMPNGAYALSGTAVPTTAVTSSYNAVLVTAKTGVGGFVVDALGSPVSGVTVSANGYTTTTDANGYYLLAVNEGNVPVKFTNTADFSQTIPTDVQRNQITSQNVTMVAYDVTKLNITGTVTDSVAKTVVTGTVQDPVVVKLEKADGTVLATTTTTTGSYEFGNTGVTGAGIATLTTDAINVATQYKVVVSKELTQTNLTSVYETNTATLTTSDSQANTNLNTFIRPIKAVNSIKVDVNWDKAVAPDAVTNTTTDLTMALFGTNSTGLVKLSPTVDYALTGAKASGDYKTTAAVNLVGAAAATGAANTNGLFTALPTLPTGTYYLRVSDGTNAIAIVPVAVTEGGDVYSGDAVIKKARTANVTSTLQNFSSYSFTGTAANNALLAGADLAFQTTTGSIVQTINGIDVPVIDNLSGVNYSVLAAAPNVNSVTSKAISNKLALGNAYKVVVHSNITQADAIATVTPVNDTTVGTSTAQSAGVASIKATFVAADGITPIVTASMPAFTVQLSQGGVVKYSKDVLAGATVAAGALSSPVVIDSVAPGKYDVQILASGFNTGKLASQLTVNDLVSNDVVATSITVKKQAATTVTGSVRFSDDQTAVAANNGTVAVYDANKKLVTAANTGVAGSFTTPALLPGTYTFVVRGVGFETYAVSKTVVAGANTSGYDFQVTRGGKGMARLSVLDANAQLLGSVAGLSLNDAYYDGSTDAAAIVAGLTLTTPHFGTYALTNPSGDGKTLVSNQELSQGTYKLSIPATAITKADTENVTVDFVNATKSQSIAVPNLFSGKTVKVKADVSDGSLTSPLTGFTGYVVAINSKGQQVSKVAIKDDTIANGGSLDIGGAATTKDGTVESTLVLGANDTYTLEVFADNTNTTPAFVGSTTVQVQDFDTAATTITITAAGR